VLDGKERMLVKYHEDFKLFKELNKELQQEKGELMQKHDALLEKTESLLEKVSQMKMKAKNWQWLALVILLFSVLVISGLVSGVVKFG